MDEIGLHSALHRPGTLVDVGAHDGALTLPFAALPQSRVIAFEPLPPARDRLRAALRAAHGGAVPPHVSVRAEALGRAAGELTLALPWLGGDAIEQWASVVKDFDALRRADPRVTRVDRYQVPVITLDSLALPDVTAIKVDAEGAEEEVLRGAGQTLARCRPLLTVELEERHRAGCTRAVPALLGELGYRGFFVQAGALYPLEAFDAARLQVAPATPADPIVEPYVFLFLFVPPALQRRLAAGMANDWASANRHAAEAIVK